MTFFADLHVHSKYSRATSRDLDFEHLAFWAAKKGIAVVGTGDCVHPGWLAEIKDKLEASENGLFRLKPEIEAAVMERLPPSCRRPVSFMLSTEISTIYKKGERTRKVHHLIYLANLGAADRLAATLGRVGNIASDGRPILGLDSRDLLEIALQSGPDSYLVPAHIWTPWFSALGAQSGFDSIDDCYGDLAPHIFAVETGLSSDPAMNWRVSSLDRFRLVSNSDAHSPAKLGREATRLSGEPGYVAIRRALETGEGYEGTVEFFPEEGKYHMDGHRACGVRLDPKETIALGGRCPVCGKPLTIGVAHRVEALADRAESGTPETAGVVTSIVPLPEIVSEVVNSGVGSKAASATYDRVLAALGPEFAVLEEAPTEDLAKIHPLLGEAVRRLRSGKVIRQAGYDGEYGVIRLFEEGELDRLNGNALLFDAPLHGRPRTKRREARGEEPDETAVASAPFPPVRDASGLAGVLAGLDADQAAAGAAEGPLMVIAGPGSGKTRMLTHRVAHFVRDCGVPAGSCLAVTFTRKATEELGTRLAALLGAEATQVVVRSFHALGLEILRAHHDPAGLPADFRVADEAERKAALADALGITDARAARLLKAVSTLKRGGEGDGETAEARAALDRIGRREGWVDFDDLVTRAADLLEAHAEIAAVWRRRFVHIVADEFQDVDPEQYRLLRLLAGMGEHLCVIGDPDQAIYSFRGADAAAFKRFAEDFPSARTLGLRRNYRSSGTIVTAASAVIGRPAEGVVRPMQEPIVVHVAANDRAEADFVATTIEALLGGHDMLAAGREGAGEGRSLGFADCAVLYRADVQAEALRTAFDRAGIPFKKSSPAPLAGHLGVVAILAALAEGGAAGDMDLVARIGEAAETARRVENADAADLAEAKGWLGALAGTEAVAGDPVRLAEAAALSNEADFRDARADRVSLLTMHAAKGLEFAVVFVVGLEAGIVPLSWSGSTPEDTAAEDEERRLFYVAMTRAKDRLILTRARERFWHGATRALPPSPFLKDIAAGLTVSNAGEGRGHREARQLSLF